MSIEQLHTIVLPRVTKKLLLSQYCLYAVQLERQIIFELIKDY